MERNFTNAIQTAEGSYRIKCVNAECKDNTAKDKQKLYVTPSKNLFHCFRCGMSGNGFKFISLFEGKTIGEVIDEFNSTNPVNKVPVVSVGEFNKKVLDCVFGEEREKDIEVLLPREMFPAEDSPEALYYLKSRGFTLEDIKHYRLAFCFDGKFRNRIIAPCFENGKIVYFVARSVFHDQAYKVLNPTDGTLGKSDVVFNLDSISDLVDSVVITEGVFDAMTVGVLGAVAIFGKKISSNQLIKIINNLVNTKNKKIYVLLDGDARSEAFELCKKLSSSEMFESVHLVPMQGDEDPNSIGRDECLKRIKDAEPFNVMQQLEMYLR